jgi:hypothetical protein
MDPKQFAVLEEKILSEIPAQGTQVADVIARVSFEGTGYARSDAKAALLDLKAKGEVQLSVDGVIRRMNG